MLLLLILWRMGELLTSWQQHKNRSVQIRLLTERTCTEYDSLSLSLSLVTLPLSSYPHYGALTLSPSHSLDYCCSFSHCCCCCCQRSGVTDFAAARQRHSRGRLLPLLSMRLCVCVCVHACNAYVHTCVRACVSVCACAYQRE